MADKVQFVLDRMAPLLREMEHFGVFDAVCHFNIYYTL